MKNKNMSEKEEKGFYEKPTFWGIFEPLFWRLEPKEKKDKND